MAHLRLVPPGGVKNSANDGARFCEHSAGGPFEAEAQACDVMGVRLMAAAKLLREGEAQVAHELFCDALAPVWRGELDRLLDGVEP